MSADSSQSVGDLRAFERDLLYAVRALERDSENPPKGLAIKAYLDERNGDEINHSRLYQNLDRLAEHGLLEKAEKDGRTNEYATTDTAEQLLVQHAKRRANAVGLNRGDSR
ncbi:helix-turn-helix transcriptional regulator [Halorussus sp. MSC15.2]|uniref:helix-turn-helix transcriptional regulator n=1 Tax=Halorussus sp. MSC15.2 TaxID=2283638 RepID=UPI0013D355B3|nr:helix-turn-helix transcriptional regulator [Halorussus sp. MSC15.2]NEU58722.1 DNA-binding protein [Halorussus sp. MSC15.2]